MRLSVIALAGCAIVVAACGSADREGTGSASPARSAPSAASTQAACAKRRSPSSSSVPGAPLRTILRVPEPQRVRKAPLVVALHFATGTGARMEQQTGLTSQARRAGFAVAYPTATSNGFWQPSDLPKLEQTIAAVERATCIDRSRVYVLGTSNGGGMASLAACRMADTVAAVVLFAPAVGFAERCSPSRAVSVLEVHGTADTIVPYAGGRAFISAWARRDGCTAEPTTTRLGARASRLEWKGCRDDARVEHLRLADGRHIELFPDLRAARIDPPALAWRFLSTHRLP